MVGGFNPSEKYEPIWESSPRFGVKIKHIFAYLKPPTSYHGRFDLQVHKFERMNGGFT